MKNVNYNLTKLLLSKMDNVWRLENYYVRDSIKAKCHSVPALEEILEDERKHVELLRKEIVSRAKKDIFD